MMSIYQNYIPHISRYRHGASTGGSVNKLASSKMRKLESLQANKLTS